MKNYFNYDFINKAIVGSKTAIKKANAGNTPEYRELCKKLAEHPDFNVVPKDIKENAEKKKYHGLTFDRMKEYILTQPDSENRVKVFEMSVRAANQRQRVRDVLNVDILRIWIQRIKMFAGHGGDIAHIIAPKWF